MQDLTIQISDESLKGLYIASESNGNKQTPEQLASEMCDPVLRRNFDNIISSDMEERVKSLWAEATNEQRQAAIAALTK